MTSALDQAITAAAAAEATYNSDVQNVANIEAAITQAQAPLVPAQAQLATDAGAYNTALQNLIAAAQSAMVALPSPPASSDSTNPSTPPTTSADGSSTGQDSSNPAKPAEKFTLHG